MSDIMPNGPSPKADWTAEDWEIFSTWLRGLLHTNVVNVTFMKVDGTERTLKCTLNPELLPVAPVTENEKERTVSNTVIAVFEVDLQEWRAFRVAGVKRVTFNLGEDLPSVETELDEEWPFPLRPKP